MTTLYQDIRKALQDQAATASGYPPEGRRAYENQQFVPPTKISWVELTLAPVTDKPFSVSGKDKEHRGLFLINVRSPYNEGPAACEALADNVRSAFDPAVHLNSAGGETIFLDYAQRSKAIPNAQWYLVPVTIGWRVYSERV